MSNRYLIEKGFTLIELLVVMAIVSVLAAVALPNLIKLQSRARQTEAKINLKTAYTAAKSTFAQTGDYSKVYLIGKSASDTGMVTPFKPENNTTYRYRGNLLSTMSPNGDWLDCTKPNCWPSTYDFRSCNYGCINSTTTTFVYKAYGQIDIDTTIDVWSIDSNNLLVNAGMTAAGTYPNNNREACSDVIY